MASVCSGVSLSYKPFVFHEKMSHNFTEQWLMPYSWRTSLLLSHTSAALQQSPSLGQIGCDHRKQHAMRSVLATYKCDEQSISVELLIYIIMSTRISSFLQQIFNHWKTTVHCSIQQWSASILIHSHILFTCDVSEDHINDIPSLTPSFFASILAPFSTRYSATGK